MGQHLHHSFVGCSFQHSIAELEVPGEACGLQIHMKHCGLAEERLCCVGTTSFSFLPLLLTPSTLLSAAAWIWQQAFGPGLKCDCLSLVEVAHHLLGGALLGWLTRVAC